MPIKKLNELVSFQVGTIVKVLGVGPLRQRLIDMGLVTGAEIKMVRCAPLGDPVEYQVKGYNLSLRKREAAHILVEVLSYPLSNLNQPGDYRLIELCGGKRFREQVKSIGLMIGAAVRVSEIADHGPLTLKVHDREVVLGQGMTQKILVEPLDDLDA